MAAVAAPTPISTRVKHADRRDSASLWAGMRSRFLEMRGPEDQIRIFDLSIRATAPLHQWAARYPLIRRERVWPLALSVAAAAPFASLDALVSTARLSLWVFTLDDLFDEEHVPQAELMRRAERYQAIARAEIEAPRSDSLAVALQEVRNDLARYPLFASLSGQWADALCGTIDGMITEYDWRLGYREVGPDMLPSYDEYLSSGLYSIGGPPHVWAALITTADPSTPDHLSHLRVMELIACTCIRLANDLRSYPKEVDEGNINALVLLGRSLIGDGLSARDAHQLAEERVRGEIANGLDRLSELQAHARTRTGRPEAAIADIARFVCDFYTEYDYHTFLMARR